MRIKIKKTEPTFTLVGVNVEKLRAFCMEECDGWTIFALTPLREMGMGEDSIAAIAQSHKSDRSNPKGMIFGEDGKVLDKLFGVYGLSFVRRTCGELTGNSNSRFMGRGFCCQDFQTRLKPVFEKLAADGVETITADHIKN